MSEYNVKTVVKNIYALTEATNMKWIETGEPLSIPDFQEMVYLEIENLADLLGIDLDEEC